MQAKTADVEIQSNEDIDDIDNNTCSEAFENRPSIVSQVSSDEEDYKEDFQDACNQDIDEAHTPVIYSKNLLGSSDKNEIESSNDDSCSNE